MSDAVLDSLVVEAAADDGSVGLVLTGSRAAGLGDESSDYDVLLLARIAEMPRDRAGADAHEAYDVYLNGFVRSTRAWERGDELGARLHAAESIAYLVRALFALERRWPPYHDRLATQLSSLAGQGWADSLRTERLAVLRTADPARQRDLEARVEQLMELRGVLAHDEWGNGLDRAKRG